MIGESPLAIAALKRKRSEIAS
jgi:hypothetical protein